VARQARTVGKRLVVLSPRNSSRPPTPPTAPDSAPATAEGRHDPAPPVSHHTDSTAGAAAGDTASDEIAEGAADSDDADSTADSSDAGQTRVADPRPVASSTKRARTPPMRYPQPHTRVMNSRHRPMQRDTRLQPARVIRQGPTPQGDPRPTRQDKHRHIKGSHRRNRRGPQPVSNRRGHIKGSRRRNRRGPQPVSHRRQLTHASRHSPHKVTLALTHID
jgi:hypothetical protein